MSQKYFELAERTLFLLGLLFVLFQISYKGTSYFSHFAFCFFIAGIIGIVLGALWYQGSTEKDPLVARAIKWGTSFILVGIITPYLTRILWPNDPIYRQPDLYIRLLVSGARDMVFSGSFMLFYAYSTFISLYKTWPTTNKKIKISETI